MPDLNYYKRIFSAYFTKKRSQLSFWHDVPEINDDFSSSQLGEYYMLFFNKAQYAGPFDENGIPLLNYHGTIGKQYNPIAIAQYGLGNFNLYKRTGEARYLKKFMLVAHWLVKELKKNEKGVWVWYHNFNFEYKELLKKPWYSGLAQGQGISVLVRAYLETKDETFAEVAQRAFGSFLKNLKEGGVTFVDDQGEVWIEEYIVNPPTHILNGFIWALWGIYDYYLCFRDPQSLELYHRCLSTIKASLKRYDVGFWSLYDLSNNRIKNFASPFYHKLHIVQLKVLFRLAGEEIFRQYFAKWESYENNLMYSKVALINKFIFKLLYY